MAIVEGVLTTGLGTLEAGRTGFVQDSTAGIAVYLDAPLVVPLPAGTRVRLAGTVDSRYAQRTLRIAATDITVIGEDGLPSPVAVVTGAAGEPLEGSRIALAGTVVEAPSALSDGLGLLVDDGTGPVRVVVAPAALAGFDPGTGDLVGVAGPLGQRDSSGTGLAGYRLYATLPGELTVEPRPTPTPLPTPTPTPTAAATSAPTPTPLPSASPSPSATPSPSSTPAPTATRSPTPASSTTPAPSTTPLAVAEARLVPEGRVALVRGIVIAEAGRLGTPPLFAIGDASDGLPVRLADGQVAPPRGALVELQGTIAAPYGQTELRLVAGGLTILGMVTVPAAVDLDAGRAGEATEGRLARISGTITAGASKATSGDLAFTVEGTDGASLRIVADASAKLDPAILRKGTSVALTGIVGQRASRKGALDGYRLWVRDRADVTVAAATSASPSASPSVSASPSADSTAAPLISIAAARVREGKRVTVEGTVTVERSLLDTSGRRTVVEDGSGAIELYLDGEDTAIRVGARVRATGVVGRAWGAPRLRVDAIRVVGTRTPVAHELRVAPGAATEWRLVRVRGIIAEVHRSGDRWTAELVAAGLRVPLLGLPGSGIASSAVVEGQTATVVGIVKRPYPTATDQRFAVVPRSRGDLDLGAATATASRPAASGPAGPGTSPQAGITGSEAGAGADQVAAAAPDVQLVDLGDRLGATVRVGGLVTAVGPEGVRLDDGTATARLVLEGPAANLTSLLQPGDALNATGVPEARDEIVVIVNDPAGVVLLGDLGGDTGDDAPRATGNPLAMLGILEGADGPLMPGGATVAAALAAGRGPGPASLALAALLLAAALGVGLAASRAMRTRRRARARIQARLDAIATPPQAGPPAPA